MKTLLVLESKDTQRIEKARQHLASAIHIMEAGQSFRHVLEAKRMLDEVISEMDDH